MTSAQNINVEQSFKNTTVEHMVRVSNWPHNLTH